MTSDEIKRVSMEFVQKTMSHNPHLDHLIETSKVAALYEIAFQLAVLNEKKLN